MKFFGELKLQKYCQSCSSNYLFRLEKRFIKEGSNIRSEGEENFSRGLQGVHVAACGVRYGLGLHPTPGKIFILGALKSAQYIVGTKKKKKTKRKVVRGKSHQFALKRVPRINQNGKGLTQECSTCGCSEQYAPVRTNSHVEKMK